MTESFWNGKELLWEKEKVQFLLFPQCFQKTSTAYMHKTRLVLERFKDQLNYELTHSHIMTSFDVSGKKVFAKHCVKDRNLYYIYLVVCKCIQFGQVQILLSGNGLTMSFDINLRQTMSIRVTVHCARRLTQVDFVDAFSALFIDHASCTFVHGIRLIEILQTLTYTYTQFFIG